MPVQPFIFAGSELCFPSTKGGVGCCFISVFRQTLSYHRSLCCLMLRYHSFLPLWFGWFYPQYKYSQCCCSISLCCHKWNKTKFSHFYKNHQAQFMFCILQHALGSLVYKSIDFGLDWFLYLLPVAKASICFK